MEADTKTLSTIALTILVFILITLVGFKVVSVLKTSTCTDGYTVVGGGCYYCPATYTINSTGENCYNLLGPKDTATFNGFASVTAGGVVTLTHVPVKSGSVKAYNSSTDEITSDIASINYTNGKVNFTSAHADAINVTYNYNVSSEYQDTAWLEFASNAKNATTNLEGQNGLGLVVSFAPLVILALVLVAVAGLLYALGVWRNN